MRSATDCWRLLTAAHWPNRVGGQNGRISMPGCWQGSMLPAMNFINRLSLADIPAAGTFSLTVWEQQWRFSYGVGVLQSRAAKNKADNVSAET